MQKWERFFPNPDYMNIPSFSRSVSRGSAVGWFLVLLLVCGAGAEKENDVLGYRPCVGMVGGKIFFRGHQISYSKADARLVTELPDDEWHWLKNNLKEFLKAIGKEYLFDELS